NVHRGVYSIAEESTRLFEEARDKCARFIGAPSSRGIVFTKNVTEAMNLIAHAWGRANLHEGDAVLLSEIEHHANLVPWLMLKEERGIELRFIPMAADFTLDLDDLDRLVDGVKLVGVTAMSNVLGTLTPVRRLAPQRAPLEVRGGHHAHRRGHRPPCRHRLPRRVGDGGGARARGLPHGVRVANPHPASRRSHHDLRPLRARPAGRGHLLLLR